uniref:Uncharacterized protein n=1 Tax=Araneus ventricosus TaxID=182803 RepID=A0A4Y2W392_ARAVE|nr:hypothetical protein AVEN_122262-1 [Araneus ventricosus]
MKFEWKTLFVQVKCTYNGDGPLIGPLVVDDPPLLRDGVLADPPGDGEVADRYDDQRHHEAQDKVDEDEGLVVGVVVLPVNGAGGHARLHAIPAKDRSSTD